MVTCGSGEVALPHISPSVDQPRDILLVMAEGQEKAEMGKCPFSVRSQRPTHLVGKVSDVPEYRVQGPEGAAHSERAQTQRGVRNWGIWATWPSRHAEVKPRDLMPDRI